MKFIGSVLLMCLLVSCATMDGWQDDRFEADVIGEVLSGDIDGGKLLVALAQAMMKEQGAASLGPLLAQVLPALDTAQQQAEAQDFAGLIQMAADPQRMDALLTGLGKLQQVMGLYGDIPEYAVKVAELEAEVARITAALQACQNATSSAVNTLTPGSNSETPSPEVPVPGPPGVELTPEAASALIEALGALRSDQ